MTGAGLNSRPLDLQSDSHLLPDTLQTSLRGPVIFERKVEKVQSLTVTILNILVTFDFTFTHYATDMVETFVIHKIND